MTSVLDEVLERVNILDLVSQYVKLRKTGRNYVGLCPFHKEKTPSFTVNLEKQIYYCFGCHEGGNVVNFVAKYDRTSFSEALETLAHQAGIETRKGKTQRREASATDALSRLAGYYQENLKRSSLAMSYLRARHMDGAAIDEFRLGYSEKTNFGKDAARRLGIPIDVLMTTGVVKMRDGGEVYDIFRGRVVVPILDMRGKVIGFGGRAIAKDAVPKYINSPESAVFTKRSVLFGIDKARREITDKDEAIIVEGYFDLIALHSAGVKNAVATLGTSVTEEQVTRLRNYTENITLMMDGDEAGIKSAMRLITLFAEMGINGAMVALPEGEAPDSVVSAHGREGVLRVMEEKRGLLDYFFDHHARSTAWDPRRQNGLHQVGCTPHRGHEGHGQKEAVHPAAGRADGVEEYRFWDNFKEKRREEETGGKEEKGAR
jgi:DNA primase